MTQQEKDSFHEWLKGNFSLLTSRNIGIIVDHVERYYCPETVKTETISYDYDDENPDQIKQSIEEI